MKKIFMLLFVLSIILSCNDGDFDVPSFDFSDEVINDCGDLVLFKINESEALIVELSNNSIYTSSTSSLSLNNTISYRIFNDNVSSSYFCNDIPPTLPTISDEWIGSGTLVVDNIITRDDEDKVEEPADLVDDPLTTTINEADIDEDGIPNYYDLDDDGDGILTRNEIEIDALDNVILIDTDSDGIPNYLDDDDDNDGILTIDESFTLDGDIDGIVDYLDSDTTDVLVAPNLNEPLINTYKLSYLATFTIENMGLSNNDGNTINHETYDYGVKAGDLIITN